MDECVLVISVVEGSGVAGAAEGLVDGPHRGDWDEVTGAGAGGSTAGGQYG